MHGAPFLQAADDEMAKRVFWMLHAAFEAGKAKRSAQIKKLLG
jgi:hypothetical protein